MEHMHTFRHCQQMTRARADTRGWQFTVPTLSESNYAVRKLSHQRYFLVYVYETQ